MNKQKRLIILTRLQNKYTHPTTELIYTTPFEFLISVLLSSKTTDVSVNKVTEKLYKVANTPHSILALGINNLKMYLHTIGLFNRKAEYIIKICHILITLYNGEVPNNKIALESLPGVGKKTTNVILNTIFKWPTIAVDTHVFRVCNRTRFAFGTNVNLVEKKLLTLVPKKFKFYCHNWFIFLGRYTCIARKPHCNFCIIYDVCEFKKKHYKLIK
ncbi:Endonuclease III [Candidatus Ecksteinia adelgidicola]|nr:Endonuclease III [Candidatus Ecksteinia adelgidicola]